MGGEGSEGMRPSGITKSACSRSDGERGVQLWLAGTLRVTPEATALSYLPVCVCGGGGLLELTTGLQMTHIYQPLQAPSAAKRASSTFYPYVWGSESYWKNKNKMESNAGPLKGCALHTVKNL